MKLKSPLNNDQGHRGYNKTQLIPSQSKIFRKTNTEICEYEGHKFGHWILKSIKTPEKALIATLARLGDSEIKTERENMGDIDQTLCQVNRKY